MNPIHRLGLAALLLPSLLLGLPACDRGGDGHDHGDHEHADHDHDHGDHDHGSEAGADHGPGHVHVAPRGGRLVVLAEEFAHLEVLLDRDAGRLDVYALDAHAEKPVRLAATGLALQVFPSAGEPFELLLLPVASNLTGEKVGDSSQFQATHERLRGFAGGEALLPEIQSRGQTFQDVRFPLP